MKVVGHTYIQITKNTERVNKIWAFLKTLFTGAFLVFNHLSSGNLL